MPGCKITNNYKPCEPRKKAETEMVYLYQPEKEWTYSHHPSITCFKGRFYAIWSNGRQNEDDLGQRVLISASEDFYHWTEPVPLVPSTWGQHSELVLTAAGFHQYGDTLTAYFGQYEYEPDMIQNGVRKHGDQGHRGTCLKYITTCDGVSWSLPQDTGLPIVPNHGPQKTGTGRLIISGNIMYPYTDDPAGHTGWKQTGIYNKEWNKSICDDSESFRKINQWMGRSMEMLCEGSFYQTVDGNLHMLLRSNTDRLWVSESSDNGETWSEPDKTDFTDNSTKFHFGLMPDGRYYYVGSPDPEPGGARNPLVLSISEDGSTFDSHYVLRDEPYIQIAPGLYKSGTYGYPHTMIQDNVLYVIYSLKKEGIAALRVKLDEL